MPILTFHNEQFPCARAQKGKDFVRLLDENNSEIFFADGVSDFSQYFLSDGEWEAPRATVASTVGAIAVLDGEVLVLNLPGATKVETNLQITFEAPCDCIEVSCLSICEDHYDVVDLRGNPALGSGGAWVAGAKVGVVLDVENKKAYLQKDCDTYFTTQHVWVVTEYTPAGKTVSLGAEDSAFLDSKTVDEISSGSILSATVFRTKNVVANADGTISAENVSSVYVTADDAALSGYFWSKSSAFTASNTYYTPEGELTIVVENRPEDMEPTNDLRVVAQSVSVVDTEEKTGTASVRYGSAGQYPNYGFVEDFAAYPYAGYKYQGYGPFKNIPLYIGSGTGGGGGVPVPGEPGATFVPSVSAEGVISWANDGGLANPEPVDLVAAVLAALPKAEEASF